MPNPNRINIKNRRAFHEFEKIEEFSAGIQLLGTEIKSLRMGKASLADSFCYFRNGELFVKMHIAEYELGTHYNHDPKRERKLLLTRRELRKLENRSQNKGQTIVPTRIFINEKGLAKLEIMLAQGKKSVDKRHAIKEKDIKRDMDRMLKNF